MVSVRSTPPGQGGCERGCHSQDRSRTFFCQRHLFLGMCTRAESLNDAPTHGVALEMGRPAGAAHTLTCFCNWFWGAQLLRKFEDKMGEEVFLATERAQVITLLSVHLYASPPPSAGIAVFPCTT